MLLRGLTLAALLALPFAAQAQSYRCVGKDGKKYYGSTIPRQCIGQPVEQLSSQGTVIRRMGGDTQASEAERAAKEAEAKKKREEDAIAKEERRRNNALLATYTSEKDIEEARARALGDNQKATKDVESRIAEIRKRQATYNKEMEFYADGAKKSDKGAKKSAASKAPPKLLADMQNAEIDLKAQENLLAMRQKEVESINAKYDEDKKRFLELTKRGK